jgi:hypothetical protein
MAAGFVIAAIGFATTGADEAIELTGADGNGGD